MREKETVGLLKEKQMIFPGWIQKAVEGLKDSDEVMVERQHTPFGSFVMSIQDPKTWKIYVKGMNDNVVF